MRLFLAYIAPLGTNGFAGDSRKIGSICRVDVGIDPYASFRNFGNPAKDSGIWIENRAVEIGSAARFPVRKRNDEEVVWVYRDHACSGCSACQSASAVGFQHAA